MKNAVVYSMSLGLLVASMTWWACGKKEVGNPVKLSVWTTESDPATLAVMREIGEELKAENQGVSTVDVVAVPWSELSVKLQQAFQRGELPGITHLEPFFAKSLVEEGLLLPLDDLVAELGADDIHEAVRDVARFDGRYWGVPQHFGVSFMAYRKDVVERAGGELPETWEETLALAKALKEEGVPFPVYFPGGDRFFIDAIFFEVLASNGGHAYSDRGYPDLDNEQVVEALRYLKELVQLTEEVDWQSATYVEGFPRMLRGEVGINLFVGARATKTFAEQYEPGEDGLKAEDVFLPLVPPRGPNGDRGFSSVDCEPFVVINQEANSGSAADEGQAIEEAAIEYLRRLYRKDNYLRLMETVPIQLIPIFKSLSVEYGRNTFVQQWSAWYEHASRMIEENQVNPYFTTDPTELEIPYLFDLYGARVITNMVSQVLSGKLSPEDAAREAQKEALSIASESAS